MRLRALNSDPRASRPYRSDEWLKLVALYWPKMARMMPSDYPVRDSETVKALAGGIDFVVNIDPEPAAPETVVGLRP